MHSIGLQGDTVELVCSGGIGIAQFIASVPAIIWIDRLGVLFPEVGFGKRDAD